MSRIRYLKPGFFKDEDIADLPHWIRLLYQGLWTMADREGRLEDRPKRIKAEVFPYEECDVVHGLSVLCSPKGSSKKPYIQRYEVEGESYIQILRWSDHQKPHHTEAKSIIPKNESNGNGNGNGNGKLAQTYSDVKEQLKDGYLTVKHGVDLNFNQLDAFDILFNEYPSQIGRSRALMLFTQTVLNSETAGRIHRAIKNYKIHLESCIDRKFKKNPQNFDNWLEEWTDWENYVEKETEDQRYARLKKELKS